MRRDTARPHDPANAQAAPDNLIIVRVPLVADHGGAQGDGLPSSLRAFKDRHLGPERQLTLRLAYGEAYGFVRGTMALLSPASFNSRSIRVCTLRIAKSLAVVFVLPVLIARPIWNRYFQMPGSIILRLNSMPL